MKYTILPIVLFLAVHVARANTLPWNKVEIEQTYKLSQTLKLTGPSNSFTIPASTKLSLVDVSNLPMLKVKFHKYQLEKCNFNRTNTDLELVNIEQPEGELKPVGVNISKGCTLDIYIDLEDQTTYSFLTR